MYRSLQIHFESLDNFTLGKQTVPEQEALQKDYISVD
jgi:hypothetical protein